MSVLRGSLLSPRPGAQVCSGAGNGAEAAAAARPQLTSLVDALTILLLFLLSSFSADGDLITPARDLVLPPSTGRERPQPAVTITIAPGRVAVDGRDLAAPARAAAADSLLIPELRERLLDIARAAGAPGRDHAVTIHCDRRIDFAVVKRVLYTCARADFGDFSLLALQSEES